MTEQLFLNKKQVDLFPKPITRKLQIADIGDISARKSSFSYSMKLPLTSNNRQILEMLGVIGETSRKPYERIIADYIVSGIYLISNGYAIITSTTEFFEVNVYDGVIDLSEKLGNKTLEELELSDLDHILTTQNFVDSLENTEGFIYGLANFGQGLNLALQVETQAPSIFTHTIFRKIFEQNGLNLTGDFFTSNEKYLSEVVTPVKGYTIEDVAYTSTAKGGVLLNSIEIEDSQSDFFTFEESIALTDNSLIDASVSADKIIINNAGVYKLDFTVNYVTYFTNLSFRLKINGVTKAVVYLASSSGSGTFSKTFSTTISVQALDEVSLTFYGSAGKIPDTGEHTFYEVSVVASGAASLFLLDGGQLIEINQIIGDTPQIDFIKDIIKRYGLLLQPIKNTTDYNFKQIEVLLNDKATAEDWTSKFKELKKTTYISGYAKKNKAVYKYPETIVVPNNDGEMLIENENIPFEKNLFTSIFEIPNVAGFLSGESVYSVPLWQLKDAVYENAETPIKTMRIKRITGTLQAKLFTEVTTIDKTDDLPLLTLENMSMTYFVGNYYKAFKALIKNYREKEFVLNLSTIDIYNLDFFRLKYLKHSQRFYYLNSVTHSPDKLSKVSMIEISDFPTNEPPSQVGNYSFSMAHDSTKTLNNAALLAGYFDPEGDAPYKIKIISGFNSNIVLKQAGVTITSETEILISELNLSFFDALGGLSEYSESWTFTVSDEGSKTYSSEIATLAATVIELVNIAPTANAGADKTERVNVSSGWTTYNIFLSGSGYSETSEIVLYTWSLVSGFSGLTITQNTANASCTLTIENDLDYFDTYVLKLTVTDAYGATGEDTMTLNIDPVFKEE